MFAILGDVQETVEGFHAKGFENSGRAIDMMGYQVLVPHLDSEYICKWTTESVLLPFK